MDTASAFRACTSNPRDVALNSFTLLGSALCGVNQYADIPLHGLDGVAHCPAPPQPPVVLPGVVVDWPRRFGHIYEFSNRWRSLRRLCHCRSCAPGSRHRLCDLPVRIPAAASGHAFAFPSPCSSEFYNHPRHNTFGLHHFCSWLPPSGISGCLCTSRQHRYSPKLWRRRRSLGLRASPLLPPQTRPRGFLEHAFSGNVSPNAGPASNRLEGLYHVCFCAGYVALSA